MEVIGCAPYDTVAAIRLRAGVVVALSALVAGTALYLTDAKLDVTNLRDRVVATTAVPPPAITPVPVSMGCRAPSR